MNRPLTEQKVLRKLNIEDFRHLTKDKVITMASMLDKMEPEVAKKALEQFPEFCKVTKEILFEYKDLLDKLLESNKESVQSLYTSCNIILSDLEKQLDNNNNLSFEEKMIIIDKMIEVSKIISDKDSENKKFIITMAVVGATALCIVTNKLASVLGVNTTIDTNDIDKLF